MAGLTTTAFSQLLPKCNNWMTKGSYGVSCTGSIVPGPNAAPIPFAMLGVLTSNGNGHWEVHTTANIGGALIPQFVTTTGGADAVVNPDCSGTITYQQYSANPSFDPNAIPFGPLPIVFNVVDNGNEINGLPMGPGSVMTCRLVCTRPID